ncbi:MAG: hypothetical protein JKY45_08060 [Emcibacter sp.]|nr:hypothetical protein [Emcibacter sp.]
MKNYEITIFNKHVREHAQDDKKHPQYDMGWADQRFLQVEARSSDEARKSILRRHPEHKGFVIVDVTEVTLFE